MNEVPVIGAMCSRCGLIYPISATACPTCSRPVRREGGFTDMEQGRHYDDLHLGENEFADRAQADAAAVAGKAGLLRRPERRRVTWDGQERRIRSLQVDPMRYDISSGKPISFVVTIVWDEPFQDARTITIGRAALAELAAD